MTEDEPSWAGGPYIESVISVDTEFSGMGPDTHSLLSIGASVVGNPLATFYIELKPIEGSRFDPNAMDVNKLDPVKLQRDGTEPKAAMEQFEAWVKKQPGRPVFMSFGTVDWVWICYYSYKYLGRNIFGRVPNTLDCKSYYLGASGRPHWSDSTKKKIPRHLQWSKGHSHNALDDALEQAELFENIRAGRLMLADDIEAVRYAAERLIRKPGGCSCHPSKSTADEEGKDAGMVESPSTASGIIAGLNPPGVNSVRTTVGSVTPPSEAAGTCPHGKTGPHTWPNTENDDEYYCGGPS